MNNPQEPPQQTHTGLFERCRNSLNEMDWRTMIVSVIGGTTTAAMIGFLGIVNDVISIQEWLKSNWSEDTFNHKAGWILTGINDVSSATYDDARHYKPGFGQFMYKLAASRENRSKETLIVYTDTQVNDLSTGKSPDYDVSVLSNRDGKLIRPNKEIFEKTNTQTIQSAIAYSVKKNQPLCLYVSGIRNNHNSKFLNIYRAKRVNLNSTEEYNTILEKGKLLTLQNKALLKLTREACTDQTFPNVLEITN